MKLWFGHGSEHSMNLVMIGQFEDARQAASAKQRIDQVTELVSAEVDDGAIEIGEQADRFTEAMLDLLRTANLYTLGPAELEQFAYDINVAIEDTMVVVTTDEIDVSAYLKILLESGARVEVFSAHNYPDADPGLDS